MIRYGFVLEVVLYFLVKKLVILVFSEKCRIIKGVVWQKCRDDGIGTNCIWRKY